MKKNEFHTCFKDNYSRLCRWAYIILGDKANSEEVVQKVFVKFWENRNSIKVEKDIVGYLYRSVKNEALNFQKQQMVRSVYETEASVVLSDNTKENINGELFMQKLKGAIANLPEKMRLSYSLKYIEGLTYKEIAEYMGISVNTVDNHIRKALKKLKEELEQHKDVFYQD